MSFRPLQGIMHLATDFIAALNENKKVFPSPSGDHAFSNVRWVAIMAIMPITFPSPSGDHAFSNANQGLGHTYVLEFPSPSGDHAFSNLNAPLICNVRL